MNILVDITGQKIGRLLVEGFASGVRRTYWNCLCDCGRRTVVTRDRLLDKKRPQFSCGCQKIESLSKRSITHGDTIGRRGTRKPVEYQAWVRMRSRCENMNDPKYASYGGRGIVVCQAWQDSYACFLADVGRRPDNKTSLGRKNVNLGYSPDNVRWEDSIEQARALRSNVWVEFKGLRMILKDACRHFNVSYTSVHLLIRKHGLPPLVAIERMIVNGKRRP